MGDVVLELAGVRHRYPGSATDAVGGIDLTVRSGSLVGIVGPNGSGKTTLLRLALGALAPDQGTVTVGGRPIAQWKRRELARVVGVVTQREEPAFPLTVAQSVMLGRYPYLTALGSPGPADREAVERAVARCDIGDLRDRWVATLSGGEWQRVRIARALAQEPRVLVLDEPTASLDIRHEMEVFELVAGLIRDGIAGVVVTHHVNLAARFVDRIVVMDRGAARAAGTPREVLTREVLEQVFEWPVAVDDWHGFPQFIPLRRRDPDDDPFQGAGSV